MRYICIYMALVGLLLSCTKEPVRQEEGSDCITFYVSDRNFGDQATKTIVEDKDVLFDIKPTLYVCDLRGLNNNLDLKDIIDGSAVQFDSEKKLWRNNDLTWTTDREYEFYGYILSKGTGNDSSVSLWEDYKGNKGHSIDIYQPTSYSEDDDVWSDYLLSYRVAANGSKKEIVRLEMERITCGVELYISTPEGAEAVVESIEFTNVTRSARYTIAEHAVFDQNASGIRNRWVYQNVEQNPVVTYERSSIVQNNNSGGIPVVAKADEDSRFDSKFRMMRFLTVPQDVAGKVLTVIYRVKEGTSDNKYEWTQYNATFNLAAASVSRWEVGRKTRYYISIDTAIELDGVISEWTDIDYVEGTFLPK